MIVVLTAASCIKNNSKIILKLSTPCILAGNHFFLFQLIAHNVINKYIFLQLPPTCFSVCYTIFKPYKYILIL